MKSIRVSLIVYFLLLSTAALAGVSWFSYETSAQALRDRQADSRMRIEARSEARTREEREDLDRRILLQAQTMARGSRSLRVYTEGLVPFGAVGAAAMPNGHFSIPIWLTQAYYTPWTAEKKYPLLAKKIFFAQPVRTHIETAEDLIPEVAETQPQEYFQTFRHDGSPMQRSESMGECRFTLDEELRAKAVLLTESFDDVEFAPGVKLRRVTLKTSVPRHGVANLPWPWRYQPFGPFPNPKITKGPPILPKAFGGFGGFDSVAPVIFIQYASELGPIEARIRKFQEERDIQLTHLDTHIENELRNLRKSLFYVALATLAAIWVGGYVLVWLGLAPLAKLSKAVSEVSAKNFHLPLETQKLPHELQPIAATLAATLAELQKAFEREKHAAADISHELRTPLAALMTTLEVGLRKSRSPEEYREILDDCHASGQHMYQLVERLLALARLDAGADHYCPVPVDVIDLALQCADLIRPLAKARGLELRLELRDDATVHTDPNKLREVLINLLHNAVEYNKPNGSIELAVGHGGDKVRIEVRDTGLGIAPDVLGHIFERFYRADSSRHADTPHAGLGLAIVKSYIELIGGTIRVASSSGGTTFTIELPVDKATAPAETGIQAEPALAQ